MLYKFMAAAHYGYLVFKVTRPKSVIHIPSDHTKAMTVVEKLLTIVECASKDKPIRGPIS
jgi:hypothetical protein